MPLILSRRRGEARSVVAASDLLQHRLAGRACGIRRGRGLRRIRGSRVRRAGRRGPMESVVRRVDHSRVGRAVGAVAVGDRVAK